MITVPPCGVGLSYRRDFAAEVMEHADRIGFVELVADNVPDVFDLDLVRALADEFPIVCHSLGLSLGTDEPIDEVYVDKIARVVELTRARWLGDHLAMTRIGALDLGQLVPISFSRRCVEIVAANLARARRRIGVPIILENISYYLPVPGGEMPEWQFIRRICEEADCGLLLDLNNLHVNATNHRYDPLEFLQGIPLDRVMQIHLAGSRWSGDMLVDSHSDPVGAEVWRYLEWVVARCVPGCIILEWDRDFPPFSVIVDELTRARDLWKRAGRGACLGDGDRAS